VGDHSDRTAGVSDHEYTLGRFAHPDKSHGSTEHYDGLKRRPTEDKALAVSRRAWRPGAPTQDASAVVRGGS
jgi:hypothetical protein